MSHTDVHRPAKVQQADPADRHHWRRFQTWPTLAPELVALRNVCGCRLCTEQAWRRATRRRDRHVSRQQIRKGNFDG